MAQASSTEMNRFVQVVDEFMANYARLISPQTRADIFATGNAAMISDYESAVSRGGMLKSTIETTVGVWSAAKREWSKVTDVTSMYIGDAVDWIKNLFGAGPDTKNLSGLGAIQIPAAIWVSGIVASAYVLNGLMTKIFVSIEASKIQRSNPGLSRDEALRRAKMAVPTLLGGMQTPLLIGAALLAYLWLSK